jgi:NAD(P)-dependent dehydrogenase (short-subunit alcohol dehydrogenase family)
MTMMTSTSLSSSLVVVARRRMLPSLAAASASSSSLFFIRDDNKFNINGPPSFQRRYFARDRGGKRGYPPRTTSGSSSNRFGGGRGEGIGKKKKNDDYDDESRTTVSFKPSTKSNSDSSKYERYTFDRNDRVVRNDNSSSSSSNNDSNISQTKKNILVIGSAGILGHALVSHFTNNERCWNVVGADVVTKDMEATTTVNDVSRRLKYYIQLPINGSLSDLTGELHRGVSSYIRNNISSSSSSSNRWMGEDDEEEDTSLLDAIVVASGGWASDITNEPPIPHSSQYDVDDEEYARTSALVCERMLRMNYYPIVAGSLLTNRFVKKGGLFVIIGASAALSPTPGMLGYGSAKSAAHHYVRSWGPGMCTKEGRNDVTAVGILPLMIDTPANRAMMHTNTTTTNNSSSSGDEEDEKYSKMVKPTHIAKEISEWITYPRLRPHSGSLVKVIAKNRKDGSGGAAFHLVR